MNSIRFRTFCLTMMFLLLLTACGAPFSTAPDIEEVVTDRFVVFDGEPLEIKGSYSITNDFVFTYYVQNAVALIDMHGFVTRDREWELPVHS
ncbi:MAG TPA: hypothetical protein PLF42_16515, partial [Anaerolineales bacterium]|nr:hypothetical protein [Anaerolineales bacterium]